jgi:hypothetical protein
VLLLQLLELMSSLDDAPANAAAAAATPAAASATGQPPAAAPLAAGGLQVDRGVARLTAEQHVKTVRGVRARHASRHAR